MRRADALTELSRLAGELATAHRELGELIAAEHRTKLEMFAQEFQNVSSVQAADKYASLHAVDVSEDIIKLRREIDALNVEYDVIKTSLPFLME